MMNPWLDLPDMTPYVLRDDEPYVEAWNDGLVRGTEDHRWLHTEVLPEPFVGPRDAPVLMLSRNPGWSADPVKNEHLRAPGYIEAARANLGDDPTEHVHFDLLDAFRDTAAGRWWRRCWAAADRAGVPFERIARGLLSVEFHGYFSTNWAPLPVTLPSQWYSFELVAQSMARNALIIVGRGGRDWNVAIPRLSTYERRFAISNPRRTTVSRRNLVAPVTFGQDPFEAIVEALQV
jgi:hypothetical protein